MTNDQIIRTPGGYAQMRLKKELHPIHLKVLNDLFMGKRSKVSFRAANNTGKTSSVITTAILYALEVNNSIVISTARVYRQVTKQLIPNLKGYRQLFPHWTFNDASIKINDIDQYIGFASDDSSKWQGFHYKPNQELLIIVDEAAGIPEDVYQAITRCNPTRLLICGSPLTCDGFWYKIETDPKLSKNYKHNHMSQYDCLEEHGYWMDPDIIKEYEEEWSFNKPFVESMVYGRFCEESTDGIISIFDIDACINSLVPRYSGNKHIFIDFAAGGDNNVIAYRNGNQVDILRVWKERDTMKTAHEIVNTLNALKDSDGINASQVTGDAGGLGLPIIHRIKELGWSINEFTGQSTPKNENYANAITEVWLEGAKRIKNKEVIFSNSIELKKQITTRRQLVTLKGKIALESKEDLRNRGISSPDLADAFFGALFEPNAGLLTTIRTISKNEDQERTRFRTMSSRFM